jgi:endonuclease-3
MTRLKEQGLNPKTMSTISEESLAELLYGVSFHNTKAKNIIANAKYLLDSHEGSLPNDMKEILGLKGVGMKMTVLIMKTAFNKVVGISVDIHVH